jgi:hypothetical protein
MAVVWCNPANVGTEDGTTRATGWADMADALIDGNLNTTDGIRVADSGDGAVLSGTLAWVEGSATINTSENLTGSLAAGDFIAKSDFDTDDNETPHEIVSITSSVITLTKVYVGATETISGNIKISTFDDLNWSLNVASIPVSCGWKSADTTEATGLTFLRKTGTKTGTGIDIAANGVSLYRSGAFRYDRNLEVYGVYIATIQDFYALSAADESMYIQTTVKSHFENIWSCGSDDQGIYMGYGIKDTEFFNIHCHTNDDGILFSGNRPYFCGVYCYYNTYGIWCNENDFFATDVHLKNNTHGIDIFNSGDHMLVNVEFDSNTNDITFGGSYDVSSERPGLAIQNFNLVAGDNRSYFKNGTIIAETTEVRTTNSRKFEATSATEYIIECCKYFPVSSGVSATLSFYAKDDVSFNGNFEASIWFEGIKITDWTEKTLTTDFAQYTIVANAIDIDKDGHVELRLRARGTAGAVYLADDSADYGVS